MEKRLAIAALVVGYSFIIVGSVVFISSIFSFINTRAYENFYDDLFSNQSFQGMLISALFIFVGFICVYAHTKLKNI